MNHDDHFATDCHLLRGQCPGGHDCAADDSQRDTGKMIERRCDKKHKNLRFLHNFHENILRFAQKCIINGLK